MRPQGAIQSDDVVDKYEIKRDVPDEQQWAFKWKDVKQETVTAENCVNLFPANQVKESAAVSRFRF